jgi:hypothetical protein
MIFTTRILENKITPTKFKLIGEMIIIRFSRVS